MEKGSFPKADPEAKAAFEALLEPHPPVSIRPMFGNVAAFVNGNMFSGVFGEDLFVRLPEEEREELKRAGGGDFAPMAGRTMKEYATLPRTWREDGDLAATWIERSLAWAGELPPKQK